VLRAPRIGKTFRLYVAGQQKVLGTTLTQEEGGKEFPVAYLSRHLMDAESRYTPIEKLSVLILYMQ
jgi:hypothetical protein